MNYILNEAERGHMRRREISEDSFREAVLRVLFEIRDRLPTTPPAQSTLTEDLNIICVNRDKYNALRHACGVAINWAIDMHHDNIAKLLKIALDDMG
jgi:hypothetical protein